MREYIRHPADIPVEIVPGDDNNSQIDKLVNLSHGGIAFHSLTQLSEGQYVEIIISCVKPGFSARGLVKWCNKDDSGFDVGVEFIDPNDEFRARMVEQICHIEHYKKEVMENEGRKLTGEQAAMEWIERFAAVFPGNDE